MLLKMTRTVLRIPLRIPLTLAVLAVAVEAQPRINEEGGREVRPRQGLRIDGAAVYVGGYTLAPGFAGLRSGTDVATGASATMGWYNVGTRTESSLVYRGAYTWNHRYKDFNSLNQALSLNFRRRLTQRWDVAFVGSGESSNLIELLFRSTRNLRLAERGGGFAPTRSISRMGLSQDPVLGGGLAALVPDSARTVLLFGTRRRAVSAAGVASYALTPRLSWHSKVQAGRYLYTDNRGLERREKFLLPTSTVGEVTTGFSYGLNPRTQIGLSGSHSRTYSLFQNYSYNSVGLNVQRMAGQHWVLEAHGGAAMFTRLRTALTLPRGVQHEVGGAIAYKPSAHSFLASVDRMIGDRYGLGTVATVSTVGAWSWQRPGGNWGLETSVGRQRLAGPGSRHINGVLVQTSLARRITEQTTGVAEAAWVNNSGELYGGLQNLRRRALRLSLVWTPEGSRFR